MQRIARAISPGLLDPALACAPVTPAADPKEVETAIRTVRENIRVFWAQIWPLKAALTLEPKSFKVATVKGELIFPG